MIAFSTRFQNSSVFTLSLRVCEFKKLNIRLLSIPMARCHSDIVFRPASAQGLSSKLIRTLQCPGIYSANSFLTTHCGKHICVPIELFLICVPIEILVLFPREYILVVVELIPVEGQAKSSKTFFLSLAENICFVIDCHRLSSSV